MTVADDVYAQLRSANWRDRFAAMRILEDSADEQAIPALCGLLTDVESGLRVKASWLIAKLNAVDQAPLIASLLADQWWGCRRAACSVLAKLGARQFAPQIAALTSDEHPDVRHAAVQAIVDLDASECADALAKAVSINEKHVAVIAASGLARFGSTQHLGFMLPLLSSPEALVRRRMTAIISSLCSPDAVGPIKQLLLDPDPEVRDEAMLGLARLEPGAYLSGLFSWLIEATFENSAEIEPRRLPYLARAIRMLVSGHFEGLEPALQSLLAHRDESIAGIAALGLGRLRDASAIPALQMCAAGARRELHLPSTVALVQLGQADPAVVVPQMVRFRDYPRDSCFVTGQELEYGAELAATLQGLSK